MAPSVVIIVRYCMPISSQDTTQPSQHPSPHQRSLLSQTLAGPTTYIEQLTVATSPRHREKDLGTDLSDPRRPPAKYHTLATHRTPPHRYPGRCFLPSTSYLPQHSPVPYKRQDSTVVSQLEVRAALLMEPHRQPSRSCSRAPQQGSKTPPPLFPRRRWFPSERIRAGRAALERSPPSPYPRFRGSASLSKTLPDGAVEARGRERV